MLTALMVIASETESMVKEVAKAAAKTTAKAMAKAMAKAGWPWVTAREVAVAAKEKVKAEKGAALVERRGAVKAPESMARIGRSWNGRRAAPTH